MTKKRRLHRRRKCPGELEHFSTPECVCVCVCVCVYRSAHALVCATSMWCVSIYLCVCVCVQKCTCTCVCYFYVICLYLSVCMCLCLCVYLYMCVCVHLYVCCFGVSDVCLCVYVYIYLYACVCCIYIYVCTCTYVCLFCLFYLQIHVLFLSLHGLKSQFIVMMHLTHFIYGYNNGVGHMIKDKLSKRGKPSAATTWPTFWWAARNCLYAPSHGQDSTYLLHQLWKNHYKENVVKETLYFFFVQTATKTEHNVQI